MKKILLSLLTLLMLCSCIKNKKEVPAIERGASSYIQSIKDYKVRTKNVNNNVDNEAFDAFLDEVFVDGMNSDYTGMHFNVIDYKKYNIDKPPVDLGTISYSFDQENFDFFQKQLDELRSFDFDSLSYRQQYDYEALEYSILETMANYCFYRYDFVFTSGSTIPENLLNIFVDFTFYDEESIEDYLTLLEDVDRYHDDALKYTEDQYNDGLPLLDEWIDYTQDCCNNTLNKIEDNELIQSFNKRLADLDFISQEKKDEYIERNKKIVIDEVLPSFKKVSEELEKYRGKAKYDDYRLCNLNKDYAELTYYLNASSNKSLDEQFQDLVDNFSLMEAEYVSCIYDKTSVKKFDEGYSGNGNLGLTGKECLEFLRTNLNSYYPDLGDVEYTVDPLDPDTAPALTIAYYWQAPIDNLDQNIIRTNPNNLQEGLDTYNTLAHEGFPGHLYQHVFYGKSNPHNFRTTIGFIGYTEGWAVNASHYALQFSGLDDYYAASALFTEVNYNFMLYSIIDIGVNYYGWSEKDLIKFFEDESMLLSFNTSHAKDFINSLIETPGGYIPYGVGYSNFKTLEKKAKDAMGGKFDYIAYHEAILKNGPLAFNILETAVDEYISANR